MKPLVAILALLLISAQADDAWAVAAVVPSAPLADDGDDYLPAQRQSGGGQSSPRQEPVFPGLKPQTAGSSPARGGLTRGGRRAAPAAPPLLYLLMSLQI
jgi:hypothetical protein